MTFLKNFKAQNNLQAILYLVATEIFGFRQKLGPWRPFKEGTPLWSSSGAAAADLAVTTNFTQKYSTQTLRKV